ncbi:SNF2 family N-terminal domain-containing protein [Sphaerosporella brunnea]|uniref:SNF2 family N-terminal domain-containing protein n=1 Tax=Sphaerosporella brunnea TaxID=1250544 RepID=A0A5J5F313_9PEZI|nr:SNF2 family N-terminal domain-containing protein [Sphaerosporella brunnea]
MEDQTDPLHAINFYRIALDEAHEIRTAKTHRSQAICAFMAECRWAVTATPLQNDLNDISTLFNFLRYEPLHAKIRFHNHIFAAKPGMENLRSALQAVCLRGSKEIIASILPSRTEHFETWSPQPEPRNKRAGRSGV